jgi:hypothetical protein
MSWYAEIHGEIETALAAYPLVMKAIGEWAEPDSDGRVEIEKDEAKGKLFIRLDDSYRNLGRHIEVELCNLAGAFPAETRGEFHMYSRDGEVFFAEYRLAKGVLYRRTLSDEEEPVAPVALSMEGGTEITMCLSRKEAGLLRPEGRGGGELF